MAPVPKKKSTRGRSDRRRNAATNRKSMPNLSTCASCKSLKLPHKACPVCGFYK